MARTIAFSGAIDAAARRYCVAPASPSASPEFQPRRTCSRLVSHKRDSTAMRRLMLLRHAKSDWAQSGVPDTTRPLNARGEAAARLMGGYMARHALVPGRVLCSPSQRTRETLAGLAAQWPAGVEIVFEERLYAAAAPAILAVIQAQGDGAHDDRHDAARTLLVIGHNP